MRSDSATPTPEPHRPTLTVGVLTMNESERIAACLESAAFADQLVVVDSGSSDDTVAIARAHGAEVHVHADWQGFAVQRNRLLQYVRGDYIFFLDADEVMDAAFQRELQAIVATGTPAVWKIRWRTVAYGRELRHYRSTAAVERLFPRASIREFTGVVHEKALLTGALPRQHIRALLRHYARDTVHESLEKLTQYAMLGAAKRAQAGRRGGVLRGLASATWMFLRFYIGHLGFLSGGAGFLYCSCMASEAYFRYAALGYDRNLRGDVPYQSQPAPKAPTTPSATHPST